VVSSNTLPRTGAETKSFLILALGLLGAGALMLVLQDVVAGNTRREE
jgi:LPXTG-motif cell wall-anchored protein